MADRSIRGRFVWNELMTPDTAGAHAFYTKALGWKSQAWDQDPSYSMFVGPNGPLGGSVAESSATPLWLPYISVDDVATVVDEAKNLGGDVVKGATDMPNGGSYAVLADPQGGQFGVYASASGPGPDAAPKRGEFSWYELATSDYQAAFDFYSKLFGWEQVAEHDMGPLGMYFIFGRGAEQKGGIYNKPADMKGKPMWVGYVRVKDIDQVVRKVKAGRGALINGPMEVPGGDWVAQFTDPYGAMFAVHLAKADVKAPGAAPAREQEETSGPAAANESAMASADEAAPKRKAAAKTKAAPAAKSTAKSSTAKKAKKAPSKRRGKAPKKKAAGRSGAKKKAPRKTSGKKRVAAKAAKRPARKSAAAGKRRGKQAAKRGGKKAARKK